MANPTVIISTSFGDVEVELFEEDAPITVANFLSYVDDEFFDGTIFHRVIPDFMIQGGGFNADMEQKPSKAEIKNEAANGRENLRGTLAMARTSVVDSASSQFFINLKDNDFLNFKGPSPQTFGYCVFGQVVDGLSVVDQIASTRTSTRGMHADVPVEAVMINKVRRK